VLRDSDNEWKIRNLQNELEKSTIGMEKQIAEFKNVLDAGIEPSVIMGSQCKIPYRCDFVEYCKKD
jgi:hypothetical protein